MKKISTTLFVAAAVFIAARMPAAAQTLSVNNVVTNDPSSPYLARARNLRDTMFECCNNGADWKVTPISGTAHKYMYSFSRVTFDFKSKIVTREEVLVSDDNDGSRGALSYAKGTGSEYSISKFEKDRTLIMDVLEDILGPRYLRFLDPRLFVKSDEILQKLRKETSDAVWTSGMREPMPRKKDCDGGLKLRFDEDDAVVQGAQFQYYFIDDSLVARYEPFVERLRLSPNGDLLPEGQEHLSQDFLDTAQRMQETIIKVLNRTKAPQP